MTLETDNALAAMRATQHGINLLTSGLFVYDISAGARTDTNAANGEVNVYIDGATIIMQIFDQAASQWRSITFS